MSLFRQFRILNSKGLAYSLNGDSGIFLHEPTGLGMKDEIKTADLGYGFFHDLKNKFYPAESVAGDLLFINSNPYELYREFVTFVVNSEELILSYKPYGTDEFFCRGRVEYLTKEELENTGVLKVPISFIPFTPWYLPKELSLSMRELTGGEMAFTYKDSIAEKAFIYDENLVYSSPLVGSYSIQLSAIGHLDASIVLSYPGLIENPKLTLVGVNTEKEYGKCEVTGISNGFEFSSLYTDSHIYDANGNSLLNGVSPGYSPFFHLPLTEPSILTMTAANELTEKAKISVYYFYRSV